MKEILGGNLDFTFKDLEINALKTFDNNEYYQIWQLEDTDYKKLVNINDEDWDNDKYGWWRYSEGSNMGKIQTRFSINHHWLYAWKNNNSNTCRKNKYNNIIEYINYELDISMEKNICALAVDIAKYNNLTLSELFNKYQTKKK